MFREKLFLSDASERFPIQKGALVKRLVAVLQKLLEKDSENKHFSGRSILERGVGQYNTDVTPVKYQCILRRTCTSV